MASRSRPPAVDSTKGLKTPCSTSHTHSPYSLFLASCDDGRQPGDSWGSSLMRLGENPYVGLVIVHVVGTVVYRAFSARDHNSVY